MSIVNDYDKRRRELRKMLEEARRFAAQHILNPDTWGYDEMRDGYAVEVFQKIEEAYKMV